MSDVAPNAPVTILLSAVREDLDNKLSAKDIAFKHRVSIGTMLRIINRINGQAEAAGRLQAAQSKMQAAVDYKATVSRKDKRGLLAASAAVRQARGELEKVEKLSKPRRVVTVDRERDRRNDLVYHKLHDGLSYDEIGQLFTPALSRERIRQLISDMAEPAHRTLVHHRRTMIAEMAIPFIRAGVPRREIADRLRQPVEDIVDLFSVVARGEGADIPGLVEAVQMGDALRQDADVDRRVARREIMERAAIALWRCPFTTTEVHEKLGINYLTVHHFATQKRQISPEVGERLAPLCGVQASWFFTGSPQPAHIPVDATMKSSKSEGVVLLGQLMREIGHWQDRIRHVVPFLAGSQRQLSVQNRLLMGSLRITACIPPINWKRMQLGRVSPFHYAPRLREIMSWSPDRLIPVGVRERTENEPVKRAKPKAAKKVSPRAGGALNEPKRKKTKRGTRKAAPGTDAKSRPRSSAGK